SWRSRSATRQTCGQVSTCPLVLDSSARACRASSVCIRTCTTWNSGSIFKEGGTGGVPVDSAPDGDPHVDRRQSPTWLEDFDRIQIHLSNLWEFFDQPRDAQQQIFDGLQVSQRLAPVALQQRQAANRADHLPRVSVGQRSDTEDRILQHLNNRPAQAKTDQRSEGRVVDNADNDLNTLCGYVLDGEVHAGGGQQARHFVWQQPALTAGPQN